MRFGASSVIMAAMTRRRLASILFAVLALAATIAVGTWFWSVLVGYIDPTDASGRKDTVQVYALIVGGVVAAATALIGLANLYLSRRNLEHNQAALRQQRELEAQRAQGVVLQAYYTQMGELLTNHDLRNTQRKDLRVLARAQTLTVLRELDASGKGLLMNFLFGARLVGTGGSDTIVSLRDADLTHANLQQAGLQDADLGRADLSYSDLRDAELIGATLRGTNLQFADLRNSNLRTANLEEAVLFGADLSYALLGEACLSNADLRGARLRSAKMRKAIGHGAGFHNANLTGAHLVQAELAEADLTWANLAGANLAHADLSRAQLNVANLAHADLTGADLTDADLTEANLEDTQITAEQLASARRVNGVTRPDGKKL